MRPPRRAQSQTTGRGVSGAQFSLLSVAPSSRSDVYTSKQLQLSRLHETQQCGAYQQSAFPQATSCAMSSGVSLPLCACACSSYATSALAMPTVAPSAANTPTPPSIATASAPPPWAITTTLTVPVSADTVGASLIPAQQASLPSQLGFTQGVIMLDGIHALVSEHGGMRCCAPATETTAAVSLTEGITQATQSSSGPCGAE